MIRLLCMVLVATLLSACANNPWREREAKAFYEAQAKAAAARKPLFQLEGIDGQSIELRGVKSITVADPREQPIVALPQQESAVVRIGEKILDTALKGYGIKAATDGVVSIVRSVGANAGNHSVTNTNITGSYNTQGDTLTNAIRGNVNGAGAGVGTQYTSADTAVSGTGNVTGSAAGRDVVVGDRNNNSGRQDSPGPIDNSNPGNECTGDSCQGAKAKPIKAKKARNGGRR